MKKLLITLPEHDEATYYLSVWSEPIIKEAEKRGIQVLKLKRERANKTAKLHEINNIQNCRTHNLDNSNRCYILWMEKNL
jgi:hypothetical protein